MASAAVVTIALMASVGVIAQKAMGGYFLQQADYTQDELCEQSEAYETEADEDDAHMSRLYPKRFHKVSGLQVKPVQYSRWVCSKCSQCSTVGEWASSAASAVQ
jgi:hypothetical protein